VVAQT